MVQYQTTIDGDLQLPETTWRQSQLISFMAWRMKNAGQVSYLDLVGDTGLSSRSVIEHLDALKKLGLIKIENNRRPLSLRYEDKIFFTRLGNLKVEKLFQNNTTLKGSLRNVDEYVVNMFAKKNNPHDGMYMYDGASFSKAFNSVIDDNPTEPILSAIAMYTELDSQLASLRLSNNEKFRVLSKTSLNLELRSARISSITIPIALRSKMPLNALLSLLKDSWSWPKNGGDNTVKRYFFEAISMGLIQNSGGVISSLKPSTTDTLSWLAEKTNQSYKNSMSSSPKAALAVFRESYYFPTEEDMLNPNKSSIDLKWLSPIYDASDNKSSYRTIVKKALGHLKDDTSVISVVDGTLVPTTILRRVDGKEEMKAKFRKILKSKDEGNPLSAILLTISAYPGISVEQLHEKIKTPAGFHNISDTISLVLVLINSNLVQISAPSRAQTSWRLFTFYQLPYFSGSEPSFRQANAVIKNVEPWVLVGMEDLFVPQEREYLSKVLDKLSASHEIELDEVATEYGKVFSRKLISFSQYLVPFIRMNPDHSKLLGSKSNIEKVILDTVSYSILTGNESLGMYASALSDMVSKDKLASRELNKEVSVFSNNFMDLKRPIQL
ncbi:Uncharacterised protein [uncultured archaeon]|nr:Uncharacterised protein [uncultured archaeon]